MTPEEARTLLNAVKGHRNEVLYSLMLSTGLRREEALGLQWQDFDPKTGFCRSAGSSSVSKEFW